MSPGGNVYTLTALLLTGNGSSIHASTIGVRWADLIGPYFARQDLFPAGKGLLKSIKYNELTILPPIARGIRRAEGKYCRTDMERFQIDCLYSHGLCSVKEPCRWSLQHNSRTEGGRGVFTQFAGHTCMMTEFVENRSVGRQYSCLNHSR